MTREEQLLEIILLHEQLQEAMEKMALNFAEGKEYDFYTKKCVRLKEQIVKLKSRL